MELAGLRRWVRVVWRRVTYVGRGLVGEEVAVGTGQGLIRGGSMDWVDVGVLAGGVGWGEEVLARHGLVSSWLLELC